MVDREFYIHNLDLSPYIQTAIPVFEDQLFIRIATPKNQEIPLRDRMRLLSAWEYRGDLVVIQTPFFYRDREICFYDFAVLIEHVSNYRTLLLNIRGYHRSIELVIIEE